MSGRLTLAPRGSARQLHEHLALFLDTDERLRFRDPRRFGLVFACATADLAQERHFSHLGLEPLAEDFSGGSLQRVAGGRRAAVKSFLMDARNVVGLGNIYVSEALHRAAIHPLRSVARISANRWDRLAAAIRETLMDAVAQGGTTLNDFTDAVGERGYFRVSLRVYDREGDPCRRCAGTIRRIVQTGRSTYYCPRCQR